MVYKDFFKIEKSEMRQGLLLYVLGDDVHETTSSGRLLLSSKTSRQNRLLTSTAKEKRLVISDMMTKRC